MRGIFVSFNYQDGSGCAVCDVPGDFKILEIDDINGLTEMVEKSDPKFKKIIIINWKWLPDGPENNETTVVNNSSNNQQKENG